MKEQFAPLLPDPPLREVTAGLRLNLGGGDTHIDGFVNVDRKSNSTDAAEYECYPLRYADGTVDEVRASHVLEHFPHAQTADVLADWVRVLKPGGVLRLAVPDFRKIAGAYLEGRGLPTQGYIMGGQVDAEDYHKAIFDEVGLREALRNVGLRNIRHWQSEIDDCAALPISLNLQGEKPRADPEKLEAVSAVMSVPRLGFMDNFFCSFQALVPLGIPLRKYTGAFWGGTGAARHSAAQVHRRLLGELPHEIHRGGHERGRQVGADDGLRYDLRQAGSDRADGSRQPAPRAGRHCADPGQSHAGDAAIYHSRRGQKE
jgi:SAM-dependent methyltransferase